MKRRVRQMAVSFERESSSGEKHTFIRWIHGSSLLVAVDLSVWASQEALSENGPRAAVLCSWPVFYCLPAVWLFNHLECSTFLRVNNTQKGLWGGCFVGEGLQCPELVTLCSSSILFTLMNINSEFKFLSSLVPQSFWNALFNTQANNLAETCYVVS